MNFSMALANFLLEYPLQMLLFTESFSLVFVELLIGIGSLQSEGGRSLLVSSLITIELLGSSEAFNVVYSS